MAEAEVAYSPDGRGLSRFTDPADGACYVSGNSYPDCGPEMFCCFDQPDMTATFRFSVRMPAGWECVANGQVTGRDGVCTFAPVAGMRPYDLAFCAGPFDRGPGPGRPHRVDRPAPPFTGRRGGGGLPALHRLRPAGHRLVRGQPRRALPYPAYDIVFTPDLAPTALSIPGLMVVHERRLARAQAGLTWTTRAFVPMRWPICGSAAWWARDGGMTSGWMRRSPPTCPMPRWPRSPGSPNRCRGPNSPTPTSRGLMWPTTCRAGHRCPLR